MNDFKVIVDKDTTVTIAFGDDGSEITVNKDSCLYKDNESTLMKNSDTTELLAACSNQGNDQINTNSIFTSPPDRYPLGEEAFGGIIIGTLKCSWKTYLLIASKYTEGDSAQVGGGAMTGYFNWCDNRVGDGSLADSFTDGAYNTYQVLKHGGYSTIESVFEWLNQYVQGLNGYNDWYIPSINELDVFYQNRFILDGYNISYGYWSSTEETFEFAYSQYFSSGEGVNLKTNSNRYVRAMRRQLIL